MNSRKHLGPKLVALQQQLQASGERTYWQSLEELADTEVFGQLVRQEFPALADVWPKGMSRRRFLSMMGASLALAGIGGCSVRPAPHGTIFPYVRPPEEIVPGQPLFYATTAVHASNTMGLLVESHEGRPTKIEGNPDHPASLGATDAITQASILSMYDPMRSKVVVKGDEIRGWEDADVAIRTAMDLEQIKKGAGLRILTETIVSPTLGWQIEQLLTKYPAAQWHQYEPLSRANEFQAAQIGFGRQVDAVFNFQTADVVLSLDADFLMSGPGHVRYANDFMSRRQVRTDVGSAKAAEMNRLYVVETEVTSTGVKADHRLAVPARHVCLVAQQIAAALGVASATNVDDKISTWARAVARDLQAHSGACVVLAGPRQPVSVHLLVHAMNERLQSVGRTVRYVEPVASRPVTNVNDLRELTHAMESGAVNVLFILGGDPAYNAPSDVDFAAKLRAVGTSFHLSLYQNETSRLCTWHLPETHYLEAWSDARAYDGTASIAQPLIEPLYQGRSAHEVIAGIAGSRVFDGRQIVQSFWRNHNISQHGAAENFDEDWQVWLHSGVIANTACEVLDVRLDPAWQAHLAAPTTFGTANNKLAQVEIVFQADPTIYDGRYANNAWLQELPKPVTKLTWDNAALMSPGTARKLGVQYADFAHGGEHGGYDVSVVRLVVGKGEVQAPAWIMPGHADDSITVYLGYGQEYAARSGGEWQSTNGFNAYKLRTSDALWSAVATVQMLNDTYPLACTQAHHTMAERDPIRSGTLHEYQNDPHKIAAKKEEPRGALGKLEKPPRRSLYEPYDYSRPQHKWGMSIDTTTCIGCNACVVACQAENNIPVVGKEQVRFGREMHWIRIDRYIKGEPQAPEEFYFQPVPCMHCEHAPCEYVCPVEATVHSAEGLNDMIYNRCVGTRFCSNNCPYKVRRFNFLEYADFETVPLRMQYNPDVTVRSRGVMEKCTYCVQRIRNAEITAQTTDNPIRDGSVVTACQAACPARAITFGDLNDETSTVSQWHSSPLSYGLLEELNTFPRTKYIAVLHNPNPELEGA